MNNSILRRREFLQLIGLTGSVALAGCALGSARLILRADSQSIPKEWLRILPKEWIFKSLEPSENLEVLGSWLSRNTDLLALGDGWISELDSALIKPVIKEDLFSKLDLKAQEFLGGLGTELSLKVFPIGVSPWVMVFRNGEDLRQIANTTWGALLEKSLKGQIIFPKSPRIVISIADQIKEPDALRKLRAQAFTFDDRNSFNWLLSGQARVAILPLDRCLRQVTIDPRLSVALPRSGAPLNWTVLLFPVQARGQFPMEWIKNSWRRPLLSILLARGWTPPIPRAQLYEARNLISDSYKEYVLPPQEVWDNCWSFKRLSAFDRKRLQEFWEASTP